MSAEIASREELLADLSRALSPESREHLLMLVRLHGLPALAEHEGEVAHEQFVARAYELLQHQVGQTGRAYKTRGDELCALLDSSLENAIGVLDRVPSALNKLGGADAVRAEAAVALLPEEASDATTALARADRRLLPAANHGGSPHLAPTGQRRRGDASPVNLSISAGRSTESSRQR